ncbi:MAG: MFS transporter [Ruminococcaceae bacterium]|nr:MFS transporter [Oscillospiraceae bacterium]
MENGVVRKQRKGKNMDTVITEKQLKRSRGLYIAESTIEYLVSILVTGSFLATLTGELGMSDSLTGILSSIVSLGCLFQLFSLVIHKQQVKSFVVVTNTVTQLLFILLYIIPLAGGEKQTKIALFVGAVFFAYLISNISVPKRVSWLMSLVDDNHRGRFTADKEIVSLLAGMAFSFGMGALIDGFVERGEMRRAFVVAAVIIFVLAVTRSLTLILTVEKPQPAAENRSLKKAVSGILKNKELLKVILVFMLYYMASYALTPFMGTYTISELGMNLKVISVLTIVGSAARITVSRFWGRYADKHSFTALIEKCFVFLGMSYLCIIFAGPSNGIVMMAFYNVFHGIAFGGVNSALTNLIFDYVKPEERADSLAVCQVVSGLTGFVSTILFSRVVEAIQQNGNRVLGMSVYAQQLLAVVSLLLMTVAILYVRFGIMRRKKNR